MKKRGFSILPRRLKSKYFWGDTVPASGIYECSLCDDLEAFQKGEHFSQCQNCINTGDERENQWFVTNEFTYFLSKNMNIEFDKVSSLQLKISEKITELAGTMTFVYFHVLWFGIWIVCNLGWLGPKYVFDPFPFGLLTMIVSLEAIFLSTFIMITQNILSQKSELRAEHEYQINLQAEKNVAEILAIIKDMRADHDLKTETLQEHIEDIKETIEEISEGTALSQTELSQDLVHAEIAEHEEESFEKQEEILEEAGIDILKESAPLSILEESHLIDPIEKPKRKKSIKSKKKKLAIQLKTLSAINKGIKTLPKLNRATNMRTFKKEYIKSIKKTAKKFK